MEDRRNGYPRLAAFINSDLDFVVFRRFGHLHVRYLLYLQDEIAEMEQQLHTLDRIEPCSFYLNTRRRDRNQERGRILKTLGEKLFDYGTLARRFMARSKARAFSCYRCSTSRRKLIDLEFR